MGAPEPNDHASRRVPWLPTDSAPSSKFLFFTAFGFYLCATLGMALWSRSKRGGSNVPPEEAYRWHFLGGKSYNYVLATLTLFATVFSAVTIAGVPQEASENGWLALRWLTAGVWAGLGMLVVVPRHYRLSCAREYDSPNDFVSDRFNNRLLTLTSSVIGSASVLLYIVIQFVAVADLVPAFSRGQDGAAAFDREATTWALAMAVVACEWIGGNDAMTWTDAVQAAVLLAAFVAVPVCYATDYGLWAGAGDSMDYDCANYFVLNCTHPAFAAFGSTCAAAANAARFETGCAAYSGKEYFQLHPAGDDVSLYYKPVTALAASGCAWDYNQSLPECVATAVAQVDWFETVPQAQWAAQRDAYPVPGPHASSRSWAEAPASSRLPTYLGIDGDGEFSRVAPNFISFNVLFFSFALFPHWLGKSMSVKSDAELRGAEAILSFATLWAVFPMILVGVAGSALLRGIYPDAGDNFYAVIVDDLANKGGYTEYVAALAAVAAVAAMMSTVDSALLSLTNLVSTDFLRRGLMSNASDASVLRACRVLSLVAVGACAAAALYWPALQDRDGSVYAALVAWQASLLWQVVPASLLGMYFNVSAWACLTGQLCGLGTVAGLWWHQDSCVQWNTAYAWQRGSFSYDEPLGAGNHPEECRMGTYLVDLHVWAAVVNVYVAVILSVVFRLTDVADTVPSFRMTHVDELHACQGDGEDEFTAQRARDVATKGGAREPVRDPVAVVCIVLAAALTTAPLPWWGDAYDKCDVDSYARWQACQVASVDCDAMCDVANMSLAPPAADSAAMAAAAECLTNSSVACSCPLQGGFYTSNASVPIPTVPVANVSFDATAASLAAGGGYVFDGSGNGRLCHGPILIRGVPVWALYVLGGWFLAMVVTSVAWLRWRCVDDIRQPRARGSETVYNKAFDSQIIDGFNDFDAETITKAESIWPSEDAAGAGAPPLPPPLPEFVAGDLPDYDTARED